MSSTMAGVTGNADPSAGAGASNQDESGAKEEGEQTPDQAVQNNDAMNSLMQMGFPMNPEQMQQQMMLMQQQMMGGGLPNSTAEGDSNPQASGSGDDASQQPDMQAMMAAMGGMPGMDMQAMMNMFGMGMPGMGNMNGMPDMSGFQNMAQMAQGESISLMIRESGWSLCLAAMGNFGNNSPVPGMMGEGANTQMDKRVPQAGVPTGPGYNNMRGGFRGRGRGGPALRGRGGNGELGR